MPTYDYVCGACEHAFEHFQSMTSRRLRKCPACGKPKLDRLVGSGAGVIFKGSGFYETDYKRSGKKPSSEKSGSSSGGGSSSEASSAKSDSAPKSKDTSASKSDKKD